MCRRRKVAMYKCSRQERVLWPIHGGWNSVGSRQRCDAQPDTIAVYIFKIEESKDVLAEEGGAEKCSTKFQMKICLKSGICQVLQRSRQLMWCHSGVGWWLPAMPSLKSESGADSLFQPTWVMLWRVFWKTKITNIYTRLPKAKADPEEGGMGQQEKILTSNLQLNPISF